MRNVILFVVGFTLIGSGLLIWQGESDTELRASYETRESGPSIEIIP